MAAFSAEPDSDCWLDPAANLFAAASAAVPAAIAPATSAAGSAASQLVEAVAAQEVAPAYPADRRHLAVRPELLLLRPVPLEVAAEPALPSGAPGLFFTVRITFCTMVGLSALPMARKSYFEPEKSQPERRLPALAPGQSLPF